MEGNRFSFFPSFAEQLDQMDDGTAIKMMRAIYRYGCFGIEPEFQAGTLEAIVWMGMKPNIDTSVKLSKAGAKARSKAPSKDAQKTVQKGKGKGSKAPLEASDNTLQSPLPSPPSKEKEEEKERDKEEEKEEKEENARDAGAARKKQKRFKPPTAEEVAEYIEDYAAVSGNHVPDPPGEASRIVAFYESKGWRVGSSPMKDWKAAVRGWILRSNQRREEARNAAPSIAPEYANLW